MKVKLTLLREMLGTASNDPDIHREFIASKAPDAKSVEEEVACVGVDEVTEKNMTVFPRFEGKPFVWDYMIKGFFKDACGAMARVPDSLSHGLKAYKKIINDTVFIDEEKIFFQFPAGGGIGNCQRPLRGQTAQGERISLANSETVPIGTTLEFNITCLNKDTEKYVKEWLGYGKLKGLGQWRNSGRGRFSVEIS